MSESNKAPAPEQRPSSSRELPREAVADLKKIAGMDEKVFSSLLKAISETEPAFSVPQFARKVLPKVPGITQAELRSALTAAVSLHGMVAKEEGPDLDDELISDIVGSPSMQIDNAEVLGSRLKALMSESAIAVTAKARDVITEHEHIYCKARILSDIRPVFSNDLDNASGAVIVHHLQIGYHQDGKHRDFYVALDTDDLMALKDVIERAEQKTAALEAILKRSNTPYLEV